MSPAQLSLFDIGSTETAPYQPDSDTSREAAERIEPDIASLRGQVLAYLRDCGDCGATDEEMQDMLAMNPSTQRPRRIELRDAGFVRDSGATRETRSGRNAVVWIAVEG